MAVPAISSRRAYRSLNSAYQEAKRHANDSVVIRLFMMSQHNYVWRLSHEDTPPGGKLARLVVKTDGQWPDSV